MKNLQTFDEYLNESVNRAAIAKFIDLVDKNDYDTVKVSLSYAQFAQGVFEDGRYKKYCNSYNTDTYTFKDINQLESFLQSLCDAGIPTEELELS